MLPFSIPFLYLIQLLKDVHVLHTFTEWTKPESMPLYRLAGEMSFTHYQGSRQVGIAYGQCRYCVKCKRAEFRLEKRLV